MKKINWKKVTQFTAVLGTAVYGYYLWAEALKWISKLKKADFLKKEEKPED